MKSYHRVFMYLIKYVPAVQMAGTLVRSALQLNNHIVAEYIIDCFCGATFVSFVVFMYCSHIFKFCNIHKLLILCNFINSIIINTTNIIIVFGTTIRISTISHYICNVVLFIFIYKLFTHKTDYESKIKIIEGLATSVRSDDR